MMLPHIRCLATVDIIALLLSVKFPEFFSTAQDLIIHHFNTIKHQIVYSDSTSYGKLQIMTMALICKVKEFIQEMIGRKLSPDLIFTLLICTELFKIIQTIPFELLVSAVNNCYKIGSLINDTYSMPSIYSLFCNESLPFLPSYTHKEYTLVLDLDETLGHFSEGKFLLRPGVHYFLSEMSEHYELVLFTAGSRDYADWAMEHVDPQGLVRLRLYRQHTLNSQIKDLATLGRDINKVIIIDNFSKSFEKQPDNGVEISAWLGDAKDRELYRLVKPLASLPYCKIKNLKQYLIKLEL
jgi:Dullard-like phosphatase family protein